MNAEIKAKWIAALRSGEYEQGLFRLKNNKGYCCLGVLCDLHSKEAKTSWGCIGGRPTYFGDGATLPKEVIAWADLDSSNPEAKGHKLTHWNDNERLSFEQIANLIEETL